MNAHALVAKNENGYLHIQLPPDINSNEVAVTLTPLANSQSNEDRKAIIEKLYGSFKSKMSIEEIDKQIKEMRT